MIKIILLISYILENVFDFVLVKLNDSYVKKPLPENVKDVYDEDKYNKWINSQLDFVEKRGKRIKEYCANFTHRKMIVI